MTIRLSLACSLLLTALAAGGVRADEPMWTPQPVAMQASSSRNQEVDRRIAFIEERLEAGERHAKYWQYGWTGFYAFGSVLQSVRAGLTDDGGHRADYIVSAVKAIGGTANLLLRPHPGRNGADELLAMPSSTRDQRVSKLARAEDLLRQNAKWADGRRSWKRHLIMAGVNGVGGLAIWAADAPGRALSSFLVGVAVGEAMIWSQPWRGRSDLEAYEQRFGAIAQRPPIEWQIVPMLGGASLAVRF